MTKMYEEGYKECHEAYSRAISEAVRKANNVRTSVEALLALNSIIEYDHRVRLSFVKLENQQAAASAMDYDEIYHLLEQIVAEHPGSFVIIKGGM